MEKDIAWGRKHSFLTDRVETDLDDPKIISTTKDTGAQGKQWLLMY